MQKHFLRLICYTDIFEESSEQEPFKSEYRGHYGKKIMLYLLAEMFFFVKNHARYTILSIIHQELQVFVCNPIPPTSCISRELTEQNGVKL